MVVLSLKFLLGILPVYGICLNEMELGGKEVLKRTWKEFYLNSLREFTHYTKESRGEMCFNIQAFQTVTHKQLDFVSQEENTIHFGVRLYKWVMLLKPVMFQWDLSPV